MSSAGASAAGAAVVVAAAIANATKASGAIIKMHPGEFLKIVNRSEKPLVVTAVSKFFGTRYKYLTSYRGLFFYTKSGEPLSIPGKAEIVTASNIWIPGQ
jgi:hypothetical protein